jgi:hypothetical protein
MDLTVISNCDDGCCDGGCCDGGCCGGGGGCC